MEEEIGNIISADSSNWGPSLRVFIEKASSKFKFPELIQGSKREDLWNALLQIVKTSQDSCIIRDCFITIRILSREKHNLVELVNDEWIELMKKHSIGNEDFEFNENTTPVCLEVLKSLSNLMYNCKPLAEKVVKVGIFKGLKKRMIDYKNEKYPEEIKFYDVKLTFLITAISPDIKKEFKDLPVLLMDMLQDVLKEAAKNQESILLTDTQIDLVSEILKLLFNLTVTSDDSDIEINYLTLVEILRSYMFVASSDTDRNWKLRNNVINLLTNIPPETYSALIIPIQTDRKVPNKYKFENDNMMAIFEMLVFLKIKFNESTSTSSQYEILSPLLTVLVKSATHHRSIRKYLRRHILPPLRDVHSRPEEGDTLRNHLCRLLTSSSSQLNELSSQLLFILCKNNVTRLVKYAGYGNAAGLLAQRGLLAGGRDIGEGNYSTDSENSETEEYADHKHGINPVSGCFEPPHESTMKNMSEEQKEYEAMKLVKLMDDLLKSGSIKPCRIGKDGKPEPIEHVLQLQEGLKSHQNYLNGANSDSD
ncbi:ric8 guanine nucleotide exchange factor A isoform X1 [Leptinotarsa decemlineata]|uniref:ric8 guanine nucleotide exchange factor A isoform X1 n=1 Tax=Leptinotarsa decemlineata TaxID=7539 RepID=UPI003D3056E1